MGSCSSVPRGTELGQACAHRTRAPEPDRSGTHAHASLDSRETWRADDGHPPPAPGEQAQGVAYDARFILSDVNEGLEGDRGGKVPVCGNRGAFAPRRSGVRISLFKERRASRQSRVTCGDMSPNVKTDSGVPKALKGERPPARRSSGAAGGWCSSTGGRRAPKRRTDGHAVSELPRTELEGMRSSTLFAHTSHPAPLGALDTATSADTGELQP
ncbi:unnamed protein product [Pedinophyceae sp. YPF-701]|nr:unnamed protein product [Pedinophyceae sp. YPF-701]